MTRFTEFVFMHNRVRKLPLVNADRGYNTYTFTMWNKPKSNTCDTNDDNVRQR